MESMAMKDVFSVVADGLYWLKVAAVAHTILLVWILWKVYQKRKG